MADYKRKKVKKVKLGKVPKQKPVKEQLPKETKREIKMKNTSRDISISNYKKQPKKEDSFKVIKGNKTKNRQRRFYYGFAVIFLVFAIVLVNSLTPVGIMEELHNNIAKIGTGDIPASLESADIKSICANNSFAYVLSDTNLELFNQGGKRTLNIQHGFLKPALAVSKARGLVYDRGGKNFKTFNTTEVLFDNKTENAIYSADISRSGRYVFSTETAGYSSKVTVFSKNNKKLYSLLLADNIVADVLLNNSGKKLATSEIYSKGGQFVSKISVYSMDSSSPQFSFEIEGSAVASLINLKNSFAAVSEDKITVFKWSNGERFDCELNGDLLDITNDLDGNFAFVTGRDNDYSTANITVFKDSKKINSFSVDYFVNDISIFKNRIFTLNSQNIFLYEAKKGKFLKEFTTDFTSGSISGLSKKSVIALSQSKMSILK